MPVSVETTSSSVTVPNGAVLDEVCEDVDVAIGDSELPEKMCNGGSSSKSEDLRETLLDHVATSKAHIKSQQQGEPELTFPQKRQIVSDVLDHSPGQFLARFGRYIGIQHLAYFEPLRTDYEVDFYVKQLERFHCKALNRVDVKNRRYEALKKLVSEGSYFSDEEMKKRSPLLYEQLVGQYLTDEEMFEAEPIDLTKLSFTNFLLDHIEYNEVHMLKQRQQQEEDDVMEEEEDSDDDRREDEEEMEMDDEEKPPLSAEEKSLLRQEFVSSMYHSFLEGKDEEFDYSEVDFNTDYDCLDVRQQDEEEKYFDSETPELVAADDGDLETEEDDLDRYMNNLHQQVDTDNIVHDLGACNLEPESGQRGIG